MENKELTLKEFRKIPGVGKSISEDFWNIGLRSVSDLKDKNPEELYQKICDFQKAKVDRCMLYVCRSSVYFASETNHKPELLKWWNWKD
ncbi:pathogenicity locus [bacterium]|nr:pathogenicity locus [bacterium]